MMHLVGWTLVLISVYFEIMSYFAQIKKTLKSKTSKDVSSSSYLHKLKKYVCASLSLIIFANWIGLLLELIAVACCMTAFIIIVKNKPKTWHL